MRTRYGPILLLLGFVAVACGPESGTPAGVAGGGAIVIVSIDTLRSDRLPAYGYADGLTPAIDSFRADAILFERAFSPVPLTLPAHASLLTGVLPPEHGVRHNIGYKLDPLGLPTLAERLADLGMDTGAAVSSFVLRQETGIGRGFDFYDDNVGTIAGASLVELQRAGQATLDAALDWLQDRDDDRFFLFLHLYEPHTPHVAPLAVSAQFESSYDAEIAMADAVFGRLLEELKGKGWYDDATIILVSDHGEGLGDHGEIEHRILLYRESLQIPLILKLPGQAGAGRSSSVPVQLTDVLPTLLEVSGATPATDLEGSSLLSFIDGQSPQRFIYGETYYPQFAYGWSSLTSMVSGDYHYIDGPDPELYDMVADPRETMNVATSERQVLTRLRRELRQVDARVQTPFEVDSQTREAMRSLGYLGSSAGAATASDLDPKAQLGALEPLWEGIEAAQAEDWSRAASRLRSVVAANPKILDAWQFLAISLHQQGLLAEALEAYREAFELSNGSPELAVPVAALSLEIGNLEDAALFARLASESQPGTMRLRILESQALSGLGRSIEALEIAQSAVEYAPEDVTALFQRGTLHHLLQYYEEAEADFERVLELAPRHGDAMAELAVLLMSGGDFEGARSMYERLLDLRPGDPVAVANLALLSDRPGG